MKNAIIDILDDFRSFELTDKAKSILWTIALIASGLIWVCLSNVSIVFQIIGCVSFLYSSANCITKTYWGKRFMDSL